MKDGAGVKKFFDKWVLTAVDPVSIALFRFAFGVVMLCWTLRLFTGGRLAEFFIRPTYYFPYPGFGWVQPVSGPAMKLLFIALAVSCVLVALGLFYRYAIAVLGLIFTYSFLIDKTNYQNHYYFVCLLSLILFFIPANAVLSLDARRKPALGSRSVPGWCLALLRFQIAIPYVFGAMAKVTPDWLRGQPMGVYLIERTSIPVIGPYFRQPWVWYFFSYGGLFFDLLVVPAVICRRTRPFALVTVLFFHLMNSTLFTIDIFPYLMLGATSIFFEPDWPRRVWPFRKWIGQLPQSESVTHAEVAPLPRRVLIPLGLYVALQLLIPLRQYVYPGHIGWHEQGHYFSWRMLVRSKRGDTKFYVTDPASPAKSFEVSPRPFLTERQIGKMVRRPDMIWDFSHYLADKLSEGKGARVQVRVGSAVSLNGRKPQLMIDPRVDLGSEPFTLLPLSWMLPLTEPLFK